jgi:hypothetical protein
VRERQATVGTDGDSETWNTSPALKRFNQTRQERFVEALLAADSA